jgi:hypothetical protein
VRRGANVCAGFWLAILSLGLCSGSSLAWPGGHVIRSDNEVKAVQLRDAGARQALAQSSRRIEATELSREGPAEAMRELAAGQADRRRMLDLSTQLEAADLDEARLWGQLMLRLPNAAVAPRISDYERSLRLAVLPQFAARQQEYRAREAELALRLAETPAADDAQTLWKSVHALASVRGWSELMGQAQQRTRIELDALHALILVSAAKAGATADAALLDGLEAARARRSEIERARDAAGDSWMAARDAVRLARFQEQLAISAGVARSAAAAQRIGEQLRTRGADLSLPASRRELITTAAARVLDSSALAAQWAAERAGMVWWHADSFLAVLERPEAPDRELAALGAEHARVAQALRNSLARRAASLDVLKRLADERDRVLSSADAYLGAPGAEGAAAWLRSEAGWAWQRVFELRGLAGDIGAADKGEKALAAQLLGAQLETLVLLEERLSIAAFGRLVDPFPADADTRLKDAAGWQRALESLQAIERERKQWKNEWDLRIKQERLQFAALGDVVRRLQDLWAIRAGEVANKFVRQSPPDEIAELTLAVLRDAGRSVESYRRTGEELRLARETSRADPLVGAVYEVLAAQPWRTAADALRGLARPYGQVAFLPRLPGLVARALDTKRPGPERLSALLALGKGLDVQWSAEGGGEQVRLVAEADGTVYFLDGLVGGTPTLSRQREIEVRGPMLVAELSVGGVPTAQAPSWLHSPDPRAKLIRGGALYAVRAASGAVSEWRSNDWVYPAMVLTGAGVGCVAGCVTTGGAAAVPGAIAGGSAGLVGAGVAFAQDAAAGVAKGVIKGAARDLQAAGVHSAEAAFVEQHTDKAVDVVKSVAALSSVYRAGIAALKVRELRQAVRSRVADYDDIARYADETKTVMMSAWDRASSAGELRELGQLILRTKNAVVMRELWRGEALAMMATLARETAPRALFLGQAVAQLVNDFNDALGPVEDLGDATGARRVWRGLVQSVAQSLSGIPQSALAASAAAPAASAPVERAAGAATPVPPAAQPPCPPGQMVGPKGVCQTEKDILAQFRTWSQDTKQPAPPKPPPTPEKEEVKPPPVVEPPAPGLEGGEGISGGISGIGSGGSKGAGSGGDAAVTKFADKERQRAGEVGTRGWSAGTSQIGGSKFGSETLKRDADKAFGGGATGEPAQASTGASAGEAGTTKQSTTGGTVGGASSVKQVGPATEKPGDPYKSGGSGTIGEKQTTTAWTRPAHWPKPLPLPVADPKKFQPYIVEKVTEWVDGRSGKHCIVASYDQQSLMGTEQSVYQRESAAEERASALRISASDRALVERTYPGLTGMLSDMRGTTSFVNLKPDPSYGKNMPKAFGECR